MQDRENIILMGDFNSLKDKRDYKNQSVQTRNLIQKHNLVSPLTNKHQLTDICREHNTNTTEYTHISRTNATRIDQAYCKTENVPNIKIEHKILGNFNHKGICMTIGNRIKWGKGIWKLNVKLLEQERVKQEIRTLINDMKMIKHQLEPLIWWDILKMKTKKKCISLGISQKRATGKTNKTRKGTRTKNSRQIPI